MKRGTTDHPKTVDLANRLSIPRYQAVGILEYLWHFTAKFAPGGNVGKFTDAAIAGHMHWERPCVELITALVESGWLEAHSEHRLIVHDWREHADQTVVRFCGKHGIKFVETDASTKLANASFKLEKTSNEDGSAFSPLPLPVPLPEPVPIPTARTIPFPDPNQIAEFFEERYSKHPKKGHRSSAEIRLTEVSRITDPAFRDRFRQVHDAWCASDDWTWKSGVKAPFLDEWIVDKGYDYMPIREPPKSDDYAPPVRRML